MRDPGAEDLAERTKRVLEAMFRLEGSSCVQCAARLCNHETLFAYASGFQDAPPCLSCLAAVLGRGPAELRDELVAYVHSKDCLGMGWRWASLREGLAAGPAPPCLEGRAVTASDPIQGDAASPLLAPAPGADAWDAGDLGCGDLLLELRFRLEAMRPGRVLHLTARDPGAREDLPAWRRLTGHVVLSAAHPLYRIRRKD